MPTPGKLWLTLRSAGILVLILQAGKMEKREMSNQERANEMGWQHRVVHGAIGREVREAYSASSAVPWILPPIRTPPLGDVLLAQGAMREVRTEDAEQETPLIQGHSDPLPLPLYGLIL